MPILGTIASSTRQGQAIDLGAIFPLQVITLSTATTSITFSNIPNTYTHLQIRGIWSRVSSSQYAYMRFNSDSGNNYAWHDIYGDGGTAAYETNASTNAIAMAYSSSGTSFTGFVWDILDYANTNKNKTAKGLEGRDVNGAGGAIGFHSGLWQSTSAINAITIFTTANQIAQNSQFALYGVKSA